MIFLSLNDRSASDYWSMQLIKDLASDLDDSYRKIVVVPGEYQDVADINKELLQYQRVLLIVAADEEYRFNIDAIDHPDIIIYSQFESPYKNVDYILPLGYTPHTRGNLSKTAPHKTLDWFFSGQIVNDERRKMEQVLQGRVDGELHTTQGFSQGMEKPAYIGQLKKAKVVPCPAGSAKDTFRYYEALEAGAYPLTQDYKNIDTYADVTTRNKAQSEWLWQKYAITQRIKQDIGLTDQIAALVPTSPIPSHPDISIIKETIETIKHHLDCPIIVMIDGLRESQKEYMDQYNEYIRQLLWYCNLNNVTTIMFDEHSHQAKMTRKTLELIETDNILFVEHDTPLTPDMDIDWPNILEGLRTEQAHMVRFHFEAFIPEPHAHMMLDDEPKDVAGTKMLRTYQWSSRPHLARADWYRKLLKDHFSEDAKTMIEDKMHSVLEVAHNEYGDDGWKDYRVWIYHPDGNIKRSYHLDGRGSDSKFEEEFVF